MSTNLRIEVRTGEAERKRVDFAPGTPVEPFSVGSAASWAVRAGGVVGVHAYLYFDGTTLFISSVGGAPVSMGGRNVGADWEPVEVPMNIHLGGAKLAVRGPTSHRAGQPSAKPQANVAVPEEDEKTQFQPQLMPEEDEKTQFQPVPNSMRQGPRGAALATGPAAGMPAALMESPPDSEATVVQRPEEVQKRAALAARPAPPAVAPESERTRFAPVQARVPGAPTPAAGAPPAAAGAAPGQAPPGPPLPAAGAPMPGAPMPGAPMPQGAPMGAAPAPTAAGVPGPPGPGGVPAFVVQPGQPGAGPGAGAQQKRSGNPALAKVKAQVAKAWREASIPQKAILILLPFAFFAMFTLMGQSEHKPTHHSANSVSSVAAAPPSARSARPTLSAPPAVGSAVAATSAAPTAASPATAKPSAPAHTTAPRSGKTPERIAVDAVAAGNYKEALEKYQALAAAHPDRPVFKQAVAILKQKLAEQ